LDGARLSKALALAPSELALDMAPVKVQNSGTFAIAVAKMDRAKIVAPKNTSSGLAEIFLTAREETPRPEINPVKNWEFF
jgi:hypothetical protein